MFFLFHLMSTTCSYWLAYSHVDDKAKTSWHMRLLSYWQSIL